VFVASSVRIASAQPNNNPVLVLVQKLTSDGGPDGPSELVEVLDDGQECLQEVIAGRREIILREGKRGDLTKSAEPDPVVAAEAEPAAMVEEPIPVIGHEQDAKEPEPAGA
jgi:hypothetical protein